MRKELSIDKEQIIDIIDRYRADYQIDVINDSILIYFRKEFNRFSFKKRLQLSNNTTMETIIDFEISHAKRIYEYLDYFFNIEHGIFRENEEEEK